MDMENRLHVTFAAILFVTALMGLDLLRKYVILQSHLLFITARQQTADFITNTARTCLEDMIDTATTIAWNKGQQQIQKGLLHHYSSDFVNPIIIKRNNT